MECQLCNTVLDSQSDKPLIENSLLFSTNAFILTPCLGPINPGHVLITSRNHSENLSCMTRSQIEEIIQINKWLRINLAEVYFDCIIAEHGAFDFQQKSGACIIHTHLHVIPNESKSIYAFDELLRYKSLSSLYEISEVNFPYILVITNQDIRVYYAENVPSQMIRKLVLASKGETENWNWRTQPENDFNNETIKIWNNAKKQD